MPRSTRERTASLHFDILSGARAQEAAMQVNLEQPSASMFVRGYGADHVIVGERRIARSCILGPNVLLEDWSATSLGTLTLADCEPFFSRAPAVVLLGARSTGVTPFLAREIRHAFAARGIALESMELGAACRTYNVLLQEDRAVLAGLFPASAG
jgi:uncharacterized protein